MIKIVTDSDANLPQDVIDQYDIKFAPIQIIFGDEVIRERVDITDEAAYERMAKADPFPTTSQPSVGEFKMIYESVLNDTPDAEILSIHVSGPLSGTVESARQASKMFPDASIHIFDSMSASLGQGLIVRQAAEMAQNGDSVEAILPMLERMRDGMRVYFVLETLDFLARGGRIGKASHLLGTVLDLKPILAVENGVIEAHSRQRTWKKAVTALMEHVKAEVNEASNSGKLHLAVVHALNEDFAKSISDELKAALNPDIAMFGGVGPGLGVHTGPGSVGVIWVKA